MSNSGKPDNIHGYQNISHHQTNAARNFFAAALLIITTGAIGTLGYYLLEDWSVIDSLYMTVITLATVGYGETHELSQNGRLFTMFLIVTSIGIAGYGVSSLVAFIVDGEFKQLMEVRRMDKRIAQMQNHVILVGGGHTGKCIAQEFYKTSTPFVVIDNDPDVLRHVLQIGDIPYVKDDATEDETLIMAGIKRAKALATVLSDDKDNMFVVLSARSLNPNLRIIARNVESNNAQKLYKAGADEVVSPNAIGGMRIASTLIRPSVVRFLDAMLKDKNNTIRFDEITINESTGLIGLTVGEVDDNTEADLLVLAVMHANGKYTFNPSPKLKLDDGETLLVMGESALMAASAEDSSAGSKTVI